jgi:hypothetical protein
MRLDAGREPAGDCPLHVKAFNARFTDVHATGLTCSMGQIYFPSSAVGKCHVSA